ncbi:hypothetical protein [Holzapfeliella sp. JNUCC 80]
MILLSTFPFTLLSWHFIFNPNFRTPDFDSQLNSKYIILIGHLLFVWLSDYATDLVCNYPLLLALLFCSLTDCHDNYIYPLVLVPSILIGAYHYDFNSSDYLIGLVTVIALLISIYFKKMGLGDCFIYLAIGINYSFELANDTLIMGCLILIACQFSNLKAEHPFVPYLVISFLLIKVLSA